MNRFSFHSIYNLNKRNSCHAPPDVYVVWTSASYASVLLHLCLFCVLKLQMYYSLPEAHVENPYFTVSHFANLVPVYPSPSLSN